VQHAGVGEQKSNIRRRAAGPTLFDLSPPRPTTRQVADRVREGRSGDPARPADLPAAVRRADDARYQEVTCRSALNRVRGMPFGWTLNPYRGCTHGCHYCFARRYQPHLELDAGDEFASVILVKVNFVEVLRRELARPRRGPAPIGFGTATDPYQPIEGRYRLSRGVLEALVDRPSPVGLITKGPMVVRDADLLEDLSARTDCTVHVSVPTVDEDAWTVLEPGTAHPRQRLRAVRELTDRGIRAGVLVAPIVPGLTSHPRRSSGPSRPSPTTGPASAGPSSSISRAGPASTSCGFSTASSPTSPRASTGSTRASTPRGATATRCTGCWS
jgi:uncharacterized Fe-S cluster-containing radical SAM superfamily protein